MFFFAKAPSAPEIFLPSIHQPSTSIFPFRSAQVLIRISQLFNYCRRPFSNRSKNRFCNIFSVSFLHAYCVNNRKGYLHNPRENSVRKTTVTKGRNSEKKKGGEIDLGGLSTGETGGVRVRVSLIRLHVLDSENFRFPCSFFHIPFFVRFSLSRAAVPFDRNQVDLCHFSCQGGFPFATGR